MPRSRGSEMPQRQSPRGPHQLRTSSSDSDPLPHRPIADRSPKLGDRRSPRGGPPDPLNQKKLGARIADLESQLGQAQDELKILKEQLASAEAAKKEAQEELVKKTKKPSVPDRAEIKESNKIDSKQPDDEVPDDNQPETDVFEVPVQKVTVTQVPEQEEKVHKPVDISTEPPATLELDQPSLHDLASKNEEISVLKAGLEEKENELAAVGIEKESLKKQLNEAALNISSARAKEEETALRLSKLEEELEASKGNAGQLKEKLEAVEGEKQALEAEMKRMAVQTQQWRKAADAAAAVLAGEVEMNGRIPERCGSMDKHFGGIFEPPAGGYAGYVGSPGMSEELDDSFGNGKRKGSGIRMFGDLWKKKVHK